MQQVGQQKRYLAKVLNESTIKTYMFKNIKLIPCNRCKTKL